MKQVCVFVFSLTITAWLNDLHVLDISTLTWSTPSTTGTAPLPRDKAACAAFGKKIIYFGGFGPVTPANDSDEVIHSIVTH